ncbi:MAG TPA: hypothetical protein VFS97_00185 [Nitrososphaeraceae archaeon]|nr:hypothetical protein [Nitrososphaeraceae archaeon]
MQDPFISRINVERTKEDVTPGSKTIEQTADETFTNPEKRYRKATLNAYRRLGIDPYHRIK